MQGGPLMHIIAAKAQCFYEVQQPEFKDYAKQIIKNAKAMEKVFKEEGFRLVAGGTDNHLLLVDVKASCGISGKKHNVYLMKSILQLIKMQFLLIQKNHSKLQEFVLEHQR